MTGVRAVPVSAVEACEPPADLVARLSRFDVAVMSDAALVEHVAEWERAIAALTARQHEALLELGRRPHRPEERAEVGQVVREFVAEEVALALRCTPRAVDARLEVATGLVRLPVARSLLGAGRIDVARARVLVEETACLHDAQAAKVDARVSPRAITLTPGRLRRVVRVAAVGVDTEAAHRREVKAVVDRYVAVSPRPDGMAELYALLPAVDARRIHNVLTAGASAMRAEAKAAGQPEERSTDQLRADILCSTFRDAAATRTLGGHALGEGCEIQVTVPATVLLGTSDQPGDLAGYGPITAQAIRDLEPGSKLRRLLTDPVTGKVLDVGDTVYRPTAPIARHVRANHPRCTFPACERPAKQCELDHTIPFPEGPTSTENLRPRCKRHHDLKHHPAVTVEELEDGTTRWHLPTGTHDNAPEPPGRPDQSWQDDTWCAEPPDPEPPPDERAA